MRAFKLFTSLFLLATATGCASARMSDHVSSRLFREGNYSEAASKLRDGLKEQGENGRDLLLYLLDLGLALHAAGQYDESNQVFAEADKIAEIKDYTSLATEAATFLTSENLQDYKGEDFEKVLINTYKAMNYALLGDTEGSLVEARVVNRKLYLMATEGKRNYKQSAFARYLSAILYEADGEYNDAYIDYKKTYELAPEFPGLRIDLWRMAWRLRMTDQMDEWKEKLALTPEEIEQAKLLKAKSGKGEIVVLYENGISPIKKPNPSFYSVPKFFPRFNPVQAASVEINGEPKGVTAVLDDIESTAIANLDEKYAGIIAKKVTGVVAKEVVAAQIGRNSPALRELTRFMFYASDQADLRSWNLLPKDLQLLRIPVDPGTYTVRVTPQGAGSAVEKTVAVAAGKKIFVNFRYMP